MEADMAGVLMDDEITKLWNEYFISCCMRIFSMLRLQDYI